jgi:hypothetical protein
VIQVISNYHPLLLLFEHLPHLQENAFLFCFHALHYLATHPHLFRVVLLDDIISCFEHHKLVLLIVLLIDLQDVLLCGFEDNS